MNFKTPKDWNKLLTLFHVLNERSFSKAADSLNLTQSAISKHVSKLEHSYKRKLLFRNKNDIKPTEDGLVIYEKLGEVISLLTDIEKTFKESGNKTLFKVYCSSNLLTHWFLDIFLDYKKTNPLLDYDFYGSDYNFDINVNDYDIIISNLHIDHKIYHKTFLGKMSMTLYASPSYLEMNGTPKSLEDLRNHSLIAIQSRENHILGEVNWHLKFSRKNPVLVLNSSHDLCKAANHGFGIINLVKNHPVAKAYNLVQLNFSEETPSADVFLHLRVNHVNTQHLKSLGTFLVQRFEKELNPVRETVLERSVEVPS